MKRTVKIEKRQMRERACRKGRNKAWASKRRGTCREVTGIEDGEAI